MPRPRWATSTFSARIQDENGRKLAVGTHVALEVAEQRLTKTIEGGVMGSRMLDDQLRITQLTALPGNDGDDPTYGLVFDTCRGDICPALKGWSNATQKTAVNGIALEYGFFEPSFKAEDSACFNPLCPRQRSCPKRHRSWFICTAPARARAPHRARAQRVPTPATA